LPNEIAIPAAQAQTGSRQAVAPYDVSTHGAVAIQQLLTIITVLEKFSFESLESLRTAMVQGNVQALAEQVCHLPSELTWNEIFLRCCDREGVSEM
jgi:hypothetical protein